MDDAKQLISEGAQLFKDGKLEEAIAKLKAAVQEDPSSVQAHSYLGAAFARAGEKPESVEQFQLAVDLAPDSAVHTFNLGQAFENSGSKPRAQALYEKALALDPKYVRAQQRLEALTGKPVATARPAPRATPPPSQPPAQAASTASAPPAAVTQVGQPYSPPGGPQTGGPSPYGPPPQQGGATQYGAPPRYDPALGLNRKSMAYGNYSGSLKRLGAALIDGIILGAVFVPIYFAMAPPISTVVTPGAAPNQQTFAPMIAAMSAMQTISAIISILYYVGFNGCLGATPGKMALGMRILKTDGGKIGIGRALGRYLLQGVFASFTCGLAYLSIVFNSEKRGWHDQIMDTMVVDK